MKKHYQLEKKQIKQDGGDKDTEDTDDDKDTDKNISLTKDVLPFVIPLICILTMNTEHKDILEMLNVIKTSPELLEVYFKTNRLSGGINQI